MRSTVLALAAILAASTAASAQDAPKGNGCFFVSQFQGWKAPDDRTLLIRVAMSHYYRLDLSASCPELKWPSSHLVMNVTGPDTICSAVDWDLKVSRGDHDIATPCIVKSMRELSPAEVAAIPPKFKPQ